jgi:hypothetical protein
MKYRFSDIKVAYIEISSFLESYSELKVVSLEAKIAEDIGVWGDDNFFYAK